MDYGYEKYDMDVKQKTWKLATKNVVGKREKNIQVEKGEKKREEKKRERKRQEGTYQGIWQQQ